MYISLYLPSFYSHHTFFSFLYLIKAPVEVVSVLKGLVEDGVRHYDHTTTFVVITPFLSDVFPNHKNCLLLTLLIGFNRSFCLRMVVEYRGTVIVQIRTLSGFIQTLVYGFLLIDLDSHFTETTFSGKLEIALIQE